MALTGALFEDGKVSHLALGGWPLHAQVHLLFLSPEQHPSKLAEGVERQAILAK